ncbi:MAG: hypothetical protein HKN57_15350 [Xanthomonadales bacterium]|nr:hypothetical protein [Gammaproteobacteria bacterium]NND58621.1 hypothetical protein [Xanthomonadales bacterium]
MKTFRKALQGTGFPITAELALLERTPLREILRLAGTLSESVDAIQLGEYSACWSGVAPLALASLLLRQGVDPIPALSCRDRNRIALQSDLLGLRALGVSSLILGTGSHGSPGGAENAKPVTDVSCRDLVAMAHAMNEEEWPDGDHEFVIGSQVTAIAPSPERNMERLTARAAAGARFLQIRPCTEPNLLSDFIQGLVEAKLTWSYSVIVTLAPDPSRESVETCARQMCETAKIPGVSGINLLVRDKPADVAAAVEISGLKSV